MAGIGGGGRKGQDRVPDQADAEAGNRRGHECYPLLRAHLAEGDGAGQRLGHAQEQQARRHGDEEGQAEAVAVDGVGRGGGVALEAAREQRKLGRRHGPCRERYRQVEEVVGDLEGHGPAGHAAGDDEDGEDGGSGERGVAAGRKRQPHHPPDLGIAPAGAGHEAHAGPPGAQPLHGRVQRHRRGRPQAQEQELAGRDRIDVAADPEQQCRGTQHRDDGDVLDRRGGRRQGETAVRLLDGDADRGNSVEQHLGGQGHDQRCPQPQLVLADLGIGHGRCQQHDEDRCTGRTEHGDDGEEDAGDTEETVGDASRTRVIAGIEMAHQMRRQDRRGQGRHQELAEDVGQQQRGLEEVAEIGGPQHGARVPPPGRSR